jgi:Flp pilus assembly protein TadB
MLLLTAVCASCGHGDSEATRLKKAQQEVALTRERLQSAQGELDRLERAIQAREGSQGEFAVAAVVAFACVVGIVLLLQLLRKERSARLTLTRLVRWRHRKEDQ